MTPERVSIASAVEGEGEIAALPVVLRRLMFDMQIWNPDIQRPFLMDRGRLVKRGGLEAAVDGLARRLPPAAPGGVLVVIDADDDCPAALGPALLRRAEVVRPDRRSAAISATSSRESGRTDRRERHPPRVRVW